MQRATLPVLLVVGGNGFLGSAISKQAVGRGWKVISISQSGRPFLSPAGHQPAWSQSPLISWHAASALEPATYESLAAKCTAAVHTVGILLEDEYKGKDAKPWDTLGALAQGLARERGWGGHPNPLKPQLHGKYERINRDSALTVAQTFLSTRSQTALPPSPFIYISAEDIFRPFVPARYITSKRAAEHGITELALSSARPQQGQHAPSTAEDYSPGEPDADGAGLSQEIESDAARLKRPRSEPRGLLRPVFLRPGLMYHPHTRPLSTVPAALFDLTSTLHRKLPNLPFPLPFWAPQASAASRPFPTQQGSQQPYAARQPGATLAPSLLTTPPLHVDTVARAVCAAVLDESVQGPVGVQAIRTLAGWKDPGAAHPLPA